MTVRAPQPDEEPAPVDPEKEQLEFLQKMNEHLEDQLSDEPIWHEDD